MGQTQQTRQSCGYVLIREEIVDSVDVGNGLQLPAELRTTLRRDQYTQRSYLPVGTLLYWYDGSLDIEDTELVVNDLRHEQVWPSNVSNCLQC